jgi:hypothetical protein
VAHLPQGQQRRHVRHAVQRAESKAVGGVFAILGLPHEEGPLTVQITLPLYHGSLDLSRTGPAEGSDAYLAAAAASTHLTMGSGPQAFWPFERPSGKELSTQWAALHDCAGALWQPELSEFGPTSLGTIGQHSAEARADALLASFYPGIGTGKRACARLLSCTCRPALAWLYTLPLVSPLQLKRREVQTGLRHRLGLTVLPLNAPTVQCRGRATLCRPGVDHSMRCSALAALTKLRYDILKEILRRAVHQGCSLS